MESEAVEIVFVFRLIPVSVSMPRTIQCLTVHKTRVLQTSKFCRLIEISVLQAIDTKALFSSWKILIFATVYLYVTIIIQLKSN